MIEILVLALLIDLIIGEPKLHVITYFAKIIELFDKKYKRKGKYLDFLAGAFITIFIIFLGILIVFLVNHIENYYIKTFLLAYLLKISFSIRSLFEHVESCLTDDIDNLRKNVGKIVSRDTKKLKKGHLYSASIESLADNLVDAIIAPLFYFILFGVYGAIVYRAINLVDSMIGYKNNKYMYFGKFPARLDDIINFIPSRLLLIVLFIYILIRKEKNMLNSLKYKFKVNYLPISLYAFILNVKLEKIGFYSINEKKDLPKKDDLKNAIILTKKIVFAYIFIVFLLLLVFYV